MYRTTEYITFNPIFYNHRMVKPMMIVFFAFCFVLLAACSSISPMPSRTTTAPEKNFKAELPKKTQVFATPEKIEAVSPHEAYQYRLGPGDFVNILVWHRPELSQENIVVSPDGFITVPRVGSINVINRTPEYPVIVTTCERTITSSPVMCTVLTPSCIKRPGVPTA